MSPKFAHVNVKRSVSIITKPDPLGETGINEET